MSRFRFHGFATCFGRSLRSSGAVSGWRWRQFGGSKGSRCSSGRCSRKKVWFRTDGVGGHTRRVCGSFRAHSGLARQRRCRFVADDGPELNCSPLHARSSPSCRTLDQRAGRSGRSFAGVFHCRRAGDARRGSPMSAQKLFSSCRRALPNGRRSKRRPLVA
jgi:hypothetical protein